MHDSDIQTFDLDEEAKKITNPDKLKKFHNIIISKWGVIVTHFFKKEGIEADGQSYQSALEKTYTLIHQLKDNSLTRKEMFAMLDPKLFTQVMEMHVDLALQEIFTHSNSIHKIKKFYGNLDLDLSQMLENLINYLTEINSLRVIKLNFGSSADKEGNNQADISFPSSYNSNDGQQNNSDEQPQVSKSIFDKSLQEFGRNSRFGSGEALFSCNKEGCAGFTDYIFGGECCEQACREDCCEKFSGTGEFVDVLSFGSNCECEENLRKGSYFSFENFPLDDL